MWFSLTSRELFRARNEITVKKKFLCFLEKFKCDGKNAVFQEQTAREERGSICNNRGETEREKLLAAQETPPLFNCGSLHKNIPSMRPHLNATLMTVPKTKAISQTGCDWRRTCQEGTAVVGHHPLLLVERSLHKVCCQRTFAFDVSRTSALALVTSAHQNLGRIFSNLCHTDQRTVYGNSAREASNCKIFRKPSKKERKKSEVGGEDINIYDYYATVNLVRDAQKILTAALQHFYTTFERIRNEQRDQKNKLLNPAAAQYHDWSKSAVDSSKHDPMRSGDAKYHGQKNSGDGSEGQPKSLSSSLYQKGSKALVLCARAHKNINYSMHFLALATKNGASTAERSQNLARAINLLEAADANLKLLHKHLQISRKDDLSQVRRKRRRRSGNTGGGPRSIFLDVKGKQVGDYRLYHSLSYASPKEAFLCPKSANFFQEVAKSSKDDKSSKRTNEIPVQDIEVLALLSKIDNLGRCLQEMNDIYGIHKDSTEKYPKEVVMLTTLIRAHKRLCDIINEMALIVQSLQMNTPSNKESEIFKQVTAISGTDFSKRKDGTPQKMQIKARKGRRGSTRNKSKVKSGLVKKSAEGNEVTGKDEEGKDGGSTT